MTEATYSILVQVRILDSSDQDRLKCLSVKTYVAEFAAVRRHRLDLGTLEIVLQGKKDVENEAAVFVRGSFGTYDHSFQAVHSGFVHPVSLSTGTRASKN